MFITGNNILDKIISLLSNESMTAKSLAEHCKVSVQAIHKVLNKLLSENVVLKQNVEYVLNQEWVSATYIKLSNSGLTNLAEGEKLQYHFNSFDHLERFWKHSLSPLITATSEVFIYNPHWIWWYVPGNLQSEADFVKSFNLKYRCYFVIGSNDPEDSEIRRQWQHEYFRISLRSGSRLSRKEYFTVIEDIVITTTLPLAISNMIDEIYQSGATLQVIQKKLEPVLIDKVNKISLKAEHNHKKAAKLKSIISKDFII